MVVSFDEPLSSTPARMIILVNLIPLFGVLVLGWNIGELLMLYWSESAAIGFYNIFKLLLARIDPENKPENLIGEILAKLFIVGFFIVHFGGFMFGHLVFLLAIIGMEGSTTGLFDFDLQVLLAPIGLGVAGFFVSHGVSFIQNYIIKKEYKRALVNEVMFAPYPRIVLMHLAILLGFALSIVTMFFGLPTLGPLLILIAGKTVLDLGGHLMEHAKFS